MIHRDQWHALAAAWFGWMLDGMDVMFYAFALTAIQREFALTSAQAGALASVTQLTAAFGGTIFGFLSDRYGRARMLIWSILCYSVFTAGTATSRTVAELVAWRAALGFGLGGEWSAGSVLVAETWPPEHRGKAIGFTQSGWAIGYLLAALLAAAIMPTYGWRWLFAIGILPALLAIYIQRTVPEPAIWRSTRHTSADWRQLLRPPLASRAALATTLTTLVLFAYWGLFTWIPTFLASPIDKGGAGMTLVRSTGWIVLMQIGAFFGYTLFGALADRFGRRPMFMLFVLAAAVLTPLYAALARNGAALMILSPFLGFFGHGFFSVFGALLAELFPSTVRGVAQGLCYNSGRAVSALAPFTIGALADSFGLAVALAATSAFFLAGGLMMLTLPETKGERLA